MSKKDGFTLIELLIVISISAILAVISIPSMMKWYKKDSFLQQTQAIVDTIYDARSAALSSKKCEDGSPSIYWEFSLGNNSFSLKCDNGGGSIIQGETIIFDDSILLNAAHVQKTTESSYESFASLPGSLGYLTTENLNIKFINVSGQAKIFFSNNEDFSLKNTKIQLYFALEDSFISSPTTTSYSESFKRTICLNRFAGFPTVSQTQDCND